LFCVAYPRSRSLKPKLESSEFDGGTPKKHVIKTGSITHAVPVLFLRRMWVRSEQGVFVVVVDLSGGTDSFHLVRSRLPSGLFRRFLPSGRRLLCGSTVVDLYRHLRPQIVTLVKGCHRMLFPLGCWWVVGRID
jgi:hypothetical protein